MRATTEAFAYRYADYGDADVLHRHQYLCLIRGRARCWSR